MADAFASLPEQEQSILILHLVLDLTLIPFRLGMVVVLSLSANRAFGGTGFARKTAFRREKSKEKNRCWQKIFHAFLYGGFQKMKAAVLLSSKGATR